jgi:hypothetical protein
MPHFYIVKTDEDIRGIHLVFREAKELFDSISEPNTCIERYSVDLKNGCVVEKTLILSRSS